MSIDGGHGRTVLLAVCLFMVLILPVSGACSETKLEVLPTAVTMDNAGPLTPGTEVVIAVRVAFPEHENSTYPETNQLELTSGLDNPVWIWNIVRNGREKDEIEERKSRVIISGDVLSWPANVTEFLDIKLYGNAPSVMEPKRLTVLRILDVSSTSCYDPVYQYSAYVLNTSMTRERIGTLTAELSRLRADAAARTMTGADTSPVMEQIEIAHQNLAMANTTPAFEFVSIDLALNRTEAALADGRRLLIDVPVSTTAAPQKAVPTGHEELPGTSSSQTPASADPAPVLTGIVACAGAAFVLRGDRS